MSPPTASTMLDLHVLRIFVYEYLADNGTPPSSDAIATAFGITTAAARASLVELGAQRMVVLHPQTREIWMAGPFSAVPTQFRVFGERATYWANCAWDMLGIPAFLGASARVETSCADCGESTTIHVEYPTGPREHAGLVHLLVPARDWYTNIGFT